MSEQEAVNIIRTGGVLVYPTETLFAIGADAMDERAANRVARIKGRPVSKPLPLIIGSIDQLDLVTESVSPELLKLTNKFWPGPLSILVKAREELPSAVKDSRGYTSVRWTEHACAAELCLKAHTPLVATSANMSGKPGTGIAAELDEELTIMVEGVYNPDPGPKGGEPSTVVEPLEGNRVKVYRDGVVTREQLIRAGFVIAD
ncbi:L-threonylcarbamoyladenylate synthase [Desulfovibrio sp. JC022]|uniref:L-threonylcarbamoyladenylate synthase n=1 Tax=Desulfovibrio sp. JC022 TaxID=2593642 RepID=UPI0013D2F470|nr:L-threonylcarbamoyladenylate synthase [Desulfovibrio sp. JC022]NDV22690.1 threonylcarbamoyl-AMP synthase [Desulfovibrio sp. JC022]